MRLEADASREDVVESSPGPEVIVSSVEAILLSGLTLGDAAGEDEVGNFRGSVGSWSVCSEWCVFSFSSGDDDRSEAMLSERVIQM